MSKESTTITKTEVSPQELNDLLGVGESILLNEDDKKPGFFSTKGVDMSFLTKKEPVKKEEPKKEESEETKIEPKKDPVKAEETAALNEIIQEVEPVETKEEKEDASKGRPKVSKDALVESTKELIEEGILVPFDDDKKIEDYTPADFKELYKANIENSKEEIKAQTPKEFFESLPPKLQYAAKYAADGGEDWEGLFRALAEVEQTANLSDELPEDQETIAREFLTVTNFGTPEEINDEITSWKDLNKLAEKAEKFKPRLEKMRSEQLAYRLNQAETLKKQREQAATQYQSSVYETLKPGKLGNLPLDKKTQGLLYTGLVQAQYPSISGRQTNLLGHLLEKFQFVEPDHAKIAKVLWLLTDEEGYENEVKKQGKTEATETIVRKLKTEETRKIASSSTEEKDDNSNRQKRIPRNNNFFKR